MACKGAVERNNKIIKRVKNTYKTRLELKKIIKDSSKTPGERLEAQKKIQNLGAFSIPCRIRNRCAITGNPRGYSRRFGVSRDKLRELICYNRIPCVGKASW